MSHFACSNGVHDMASSLRRSWRQDVSVLVPEANALGMIGVIRSLGRAGYRVHTCASQADALGLRSNFAHKSIVCPSYSDESFLPWLRNYVQANGIQVIIPSEGFVHAIRSVFDELQPLMPVAEDPAIVYRAFSKVDVADSLAESPDSVDFSKHNPPGFIVRRNLESPDLRAVEALPLPIYVKSDAKYCDVGDEPMFRRLVSHEDVVPLVEKQLRNYEAILVQGHVPGVKAAAAYCLKNGDVLTKTEVLGLRTTPYTGGMMSLRKTTRNEALASASLKWLKFLKWEGVAMVECKWDPSTGEFWFIELNPRYWGYLHLDLFSGVDVPRIQVDHFLGCGEDIQPSQQLGVTVRHTVPGDVGFLGSLIRDPKVPFRKKARASVRFAVDFLRPDIRSDLLFPGDSGLYWIQWWLFLKSAVRALANRLGRER